jgi:hypothetical protein
MAPDLCSKDNGLVAANGQAKAVQSHRHLTSPLSGQGLHTITCATLSELFVIQDYGLLRQYKILSLGSNVRNSRALSSL